MNVQAQAQIQETQKLAPNNIPVPWYSQKNRGMPLLALLSGFFVNGL